MMVNDIFQIIYIYRNPKASVLSLYKVLKYLNMPPAPSLREYFELFLKGNEGGTFNQKRLFCISVTHYRSILNLDESGESMM